MGRATLVSAVLAVLSIGAGAQEPVFRAGARTVPIYATVRDQQGRLVPGLTRSDFQVLDDGRPAPVAVFSNDVLPASIALMLDMSTSMIGEQLRVRDSALHFVDNLLPDDRVRVGTFGEEIALSPLITSDKKVLGRVLREEVWPGGETPLWSAMRAAMTSLNDETNRRVVVTLTDGIDTGCPRMIGALPEPDDRHVVRTSFVSSGPRANGPDFGRQSRTSLFLQSSPRCANLADVEKVGLESDFMVYAIGMEGPGLTGGLVKLADETGGGHFELKKNVDLTSTFTAVAEELHHQYALGVTPIALDGRVHTLEVRINRAGLTARARKSYLAVQK